MKKIITLLLALLTVLTLAGCGSKPQEGGNEPAEDKTITVGVNPVPHAEILEWKVLNCDVALKLVHLPVPIQICRELFFCLKNTFSVIQGFLQFVALVPGDLPTAVGYDIINSKHLANKWFPRMYALYAHESDSMRPP